LAPAGGAAAPADAPGVLRAAEPPGRVPGAPPRPGDLVRVPSLGLEGELESVDEARAFIRVRGRRVRVPAADLVPAGPGA